MSSKDKSDDFPSSPWERFEIQYDGDSPTTIYYQSPWELYDPESLWEHPHLDCETTDELLSAFAHLQQSVRKNQVTLLTSLVSLCIPFFGMFSFIEYVVNIAGSLRNS